MDVKKSINENLFKKLEYFAPLKLADSWDNVGFLITPDIDVKINKIIVTNDLTRRVMDEAISEKVQMIISYHPPIFNSLKRIRQNCWKEMLVSKCIKNDIFVYSPHTAFDSVNGGINDWILSDFDIKFKEPIKLFEGLISDNMSDGEKLIHGSGRFCELNHPISISKAIDLLKKRFRLNDLLLAQSHISRGKSDFMIQSIAICPGSGSSLLKLCEKRADLWITGEMSHHELLDVTENIDNPTSVILTTGHSNSERGFLVDVFQPWLAKEMLSDNVEVFVSKTDSDPLMII